jgi:hypothetical protein
VGSSPLPTKKHANIEWNHPVSLGSKKFKMGKPAGKLMAMVFWDRKGVLLMDFMEKGPTINAASYCATRHPKTVMSSH